jgi:hypothetical protein
MSGSPRADRAAPNRLRDLCSRFLVDGFSAPAMSTTHCPDSLWTRALDALDHLLIDGLLGLSDPAAESRTKWRTRILLWILVRVERLLSAGHAKHRLHGGGVFLYEVTRLPRGTRPLPLDPPVVAGDPVIVLHFDNAALAALFAGDRRAGHVAWELVTRCKADLADLARLVQAGQLPAEVRALWAETVLYRAMRRLGFETRPSRPTLRRPFSRFYSAALLAIYGPGGRAARNAQLWRHYDLGEGWLSLDELLSLYVATDRV